VPYTTPLCSSCVTMRSHPSPSYCNYVTPDPEWAICTHLIPSPHTDQSTLRVASRLQEKKAHDRSILDSARFGEAVPKQQFLVLIPPFHATSKSTSLLYMSTIWPWAVEIIILIIRERRMHEHRIRTAKSPTSKHSSLPIS
jgi:hypothetical protein